MTDNPIATFGGGTGLMTREAMGEFLNSAAQAAPAAGGKQFLKISDKDGAWTYGAEETVVEDGSLWAINPISMFHGYIAWFEAKVEGEHRQSITRPLPADPVATFGPVKALRGWEKQFGFDIVCVSGEDAGVLCEYKASSVGGSRAFGAMVTALNQQFMADPDSIIPVVRLKDRKYWDDKYKKDQFPPVFEIVEWRRADDASAPKEQVEPEKKPEPEPPTRQRTRAAAPAQQPVKEDPPPEDNDAAEQYAAAEAAQAEVPRRRQRRG